MAVSSELDVKMESLCSSFSSHECSWALLTYSSCFVFSYLEKLFTFVNCPQMLKLHEQQFLGEASCNLSEVSSWKICFITPCKIYKSALFGKLYIFMMEYMIMM